MYSLPDPGKPGNAGAFKQSFGQSVTPEGGGAHNKHKKCGVAVFGLSLAEE